MKRKRSDRSNWQRVTRRRFLLQAIEDDAFQGYISLFCIDELREPLWVPYAGQQICIAERGHSWLQLFPQGANHVATVMFDERGEIVQWYVDICKQAYSDEEGIVWYEDLYLDIVFLPGNKIELLDVDELDEALSQGVISTDEYNLAWHEANKLLKEIVEQRFPLLSLPERYRASLLAQLPPSST